MKKYSDDNDDEYQNIKPGSINSDDLFDSSDTPFEENEVEVEVVNSEEPTEDYSDYMFDSNDEAVSLSNDDYEDEDAYEEEPEPSVFEVSNKDDEDIISETKVPEEFNSNEFDGDTLSSVEVKPEEIQKPSYVETADKQIEKALDEIHRQNEEEVVEKIAEIVEQEETSEKEVMNEMVDSAMESLKEEETISSTKPIFTEEVPSEDKNVYEEPSDEIPEKFKEDSEEIKDVGFEEDKDSIIDNPSTAPIEDIKPEEEKEVIIPIPDGEVSDEPKPVVENTIEEKQEKLDEDFETDKMEKTIEQIDNSSQDSSKLTPEEEAYYASEADGSLADFMKKAFKRHLAEIQDKFTENSLVNYLEYYASEEDRKLIQDQYCFNYSKYYKYVDFTNPNAKAALWIITAGEFAQLIEMKKFNGEIQPVLEKGNAYENDPNNIEDENITMLKNKRSKEKIEQNKYGIDRVVWDIDDDVAEENTSIFDEQKELYAEFEKSEFYGILTQVLESTRIADMSKIDCKVSIKEQCGYYPIIDFNTGIRVICIDTEDTSQYNSHPLLFSRKLPFAFKIPRTGIKTRIIYSDVCRECPIATVFALKKLIAYDYIKPRYKINIANNYVISYTTEQTYLDMFEKGDPDSKRPGSSTYYAPKPATNFLGIVVLDKKTEKDIKTIHRNQVYKDLKQMPDVSVDNYDPQFILSARYIKNDLRLRNPTIPANQRFVEYTITQYTECNSVIINDGIQVVCACIIKEHKNNYAPGTPYSIAFEYDRDNLLTPAVVRMLDNHDGFELSMIKKCAPLEQMPQFILPPSRKKLDGVLPSEKGRLDIRYFTPQTIQGRYREQRDLWSRYDLTTQQGRNEFIKSRGFEVFMAPKYMTFDIMPECLMNVENGNVIRNIQKISITALSDRNSDDTINLLTKQKEMEYYRNIDNSEMGTFQKFLINAANIMLDFMSTNQTN